MTGSLAGLFHGLFHILAGGGDAPLGDLDADPVLAGLKGDIVAGNVDDLAHHTADGDDVVTHGQGVAHFLGFFLALLLGADHQEVENGNDDEQVDDHDGPSAATAGCLGAVRCGPVAGVGGRGEAPGEGRQHEADAHEHDQNTFDLLRRHGKPPNSMV